MDGCREAVRERENAWAREEGLLLSLLPLSFALALAPFVSFLLFAVSSLSSLSHSWRGCPCPVLSLHTTQKKEKRNKKKKQSLLPAINKQSNTRPPPKGRIRRIRIHAFTLPPNLRPDTSTANWKAWP